MKTIIALLGTLVLFASICPAKDVIAEPTTPTKADTLTQKEPVFGLMENKLDKGGFKSLKNKIPAILDLVNGPTCGCSGAHDCCISNVCVKQCR
jgi:hypothetical protein